MQRATQCIFFHLLLPVICFGSVGITNAAGPISIDSLVSNEQKVTLEDGALSDRFGYSVSLFGDTALVSKYSFGVHVYVRNGPTWVHQAELTTSDATVDSSYGRSISLHGDTALVGAPSDYGNDEYTGSVYVFTRNGTTWSQQAKLIASDGATSDYFGVSISFSGYRALIGAWGDDSLARGEAVGAAYIFKRIGETWSQEAKLTASDGRELDKFGQSVAIYENLALVGAYLDDDNGNDSGSVYSFIRSEVPPHNWERLWPFKITASDGAAGDHFGESLSLTSTELGATAVIGAWGDDLESGSAYIWTRSEDVTWGPQAKLTASDSFGGDEFGLSVSVSETGDTVLIGAFGNDDNGAASGSAYLFTRSDENWGQQAKITPSDGAAGDYFGWSVSLSGDFALIGAYGDDVTVNSAGSAYFYRLSDSFYVGGTVSGLAAGNSVALQNNVGDDLVVSSNTSFVFDTALPDGSAYEVTVLNQPTTPSQSCAVTNGSGTLASVDVTDVSVSCVTDTFTVGGTVSGLEGSGLVLQNNDGDDLMIDTDGSFTLASPLDDGSSYSVSVLTQPSSPNQTCMVSNGGGALAGADVTNVSVDCVTDTFLVGGTVSGLTGTGLVLQNNGGDDLEITIDGYFTFATPLDDLSSYSVTVLTQPDTPSQTCIATNGSGNLAGGDVTDVTVICTTHTFTVGGTVNGLEGSGLVLRNNGGDDLPIAVDGSFTFATLLVDGSTYSVTILSEPVGPNQICNVSNGSGKLSGDNVIDVTVACNKPEDIFANGFEDAFYKY